MSEEWSITPPAFKPDEALLRLRRELRELGLQEREGRFERRGSAVARAAVSGEALQVALAKRASRSPEWQDKRLTNSAQLRDWVALVKKNLATWSDSDE